MDGHAAHRQLLELDRSLGCERRALDLGVGRVRLTGLDAALSESLARRWGAFLEPDDGLASAACDVRVLSSPQPWLSAENDALYRIEAFNDSDRRLVASYNFALCEEQGPTCLRVALHEDGDEPLERQLENAVRYVAARLALSAGGFALHGAGVLHRGRAHVFAGPSGSGKTSAVRLAGRPALGDDFAVIAREGEAWVAAALPFDNAERIVGDPPRGLFPLDGVWRMFKADETRTERPGRGVALPSLLGCAAFPWLLPEAAGILLDRCAQLVEGGRFGHLHFSLDGDLWTELLR